MKGLKTGYVFVITTLLTLSVVIGIVAFYPAPKRFDYPTYPQTSGLDYNSPEYKNQQKKYDADLKNYTEKNKDITSKVKIWGEKVFIINLLIGVVLLIIGMLLLNIVPLLGVAILFASFMLMVFGAGLTSLYADNTSIPLLTTTSKVDLSLYKKIQFVILLIGTIIGAVLGIVKFKIQAKQS